MIKIIGLIILFMGTGFSQAQNHRLLGGISIGGNISSLRGNEIVKEQNRAYFGGNYGIQLQYNFNDLLSLNTSILYERKSAVANIGSADSAYKVFSNFRYITVPLLIRYYFGFSKNWYCETGPLVGRLLNQEFSMKEAGAPEIVADNSDRIKNWDGAWVLGVGCLFNVSKRIYFTAGLRNSFGLLNVSAVQVYNNGSIKTNSTSINIGLVYGFSKL